MADNSAPRTVVITGVSGLIGYHLAERLCGADSSSQVTGISRAVNTNLQDLSRHQCFRFVPRDLLLSGDLKSIFAGAEVVYHLAAQSAVYQALKDPVADLRTNAEATLRVARAAAAAGVTRLVYTSGGAVYPSQSYAREDQIGWPPTFYGASKLAAESYVRIVAQSSGLNFAILRLARVYGARMTRGAIFDLIQAFVQRRPADLFANPDSAFDFVYVEDVVSALLAAASPSWSGVTANVSSGEGTRLRTLHHTFERLFGYSVPLVERPMPRTVDVLVRDYARSLGWEPTHTLYQGLDLTLSHFVSR